MPNLVSFQVGMKRNKPIKARLGIRFFPPLNCLGNNKTPEIQLLEVRMLVASACILLSCNLYQFQLEPQV